MGKPVNEAVGDGRVLRVDLRVLCRRAERFLSAEGVEPDQLGTTHP